MSQDTDHEQQRFEDPGGEVYDFFRFLYELDPKDSHLAYEAWYELSFEEKIFWAKVLHLKQRLGVSYKGGGTNPSAPQIPSDIIQLGTSAATKVRGIPLQCNVQLMVKFSVVAPAIPERGVCWRMGASNSPSRTPSSGAERSPQLNVAGNSTVYDFFLARKEPRVDSDQSTAIPI